MMLKRPRSWYQTRRRLTMARAVAGGVLVAVTLGACGSTGFPIEAPTPTAAAVPMLPSPTVVTAMEIGSGSVGGAAAVVATATSLPPTPTPLPAIAPVMTTPPTAISTPRPSPVPTTAMVARTGPAMVTPTRPIAPAMQMSPTTQAMPTAPAALTMLTMPTAPAMAAQGIGPAGALPPPTPLPRGGPVPPGWNVYQTPTRQPPFAIAYPPDWTVEEDFNNAEGPQVFFRSPNDPMRVYMAIQVDKFALIGAEQGDETRDNLFRFRSGCEATRSGLDVTRENTFAGMPVKSVGMTCDARGGLLYLYLGVGLGTDPKRTYAPWYFRSRAPYDDYPRYAETVFLPMLNSLTITPPSQPRP